MKLAAAFIGAALGQAVAPITANPNASKEQYKAKRKLQKLRPHITPHMHNIARHIATEKTWIVAREKMKHGFTMIKRGWRGVDTYKNEKGIVCPAVVPLAATKATRRMVRRQKRNDQSWR